MVILRIVLAVAVFGIPCVLAAWVGSRLRAGFPAFFLAWFLTPLFTGVMLVLVWPFMVMAMDPNSDGTGAIILPFLGIFTGLGSGIAAAVMVARNQKKLPDSIATDSTGDTPTPS